MQRLQEDIAYVDASAILAIAFGEYGWQAISARLGEFSTLISSNLLEAEVRSAYARDRNTPEPDVLSNIDWILPDRPLSAEMEKVLDAGYLRGADLFHIAVALYFVEDPADIWFITLDRRQRAVAAALGFRA